MALLTLKQSNLAYGADFLLYGGAVAAMGVALLVASPRADYLGETAAALGGLLSCSLIEYALHRFVLHGLQPFRRWHAAHEAPAFDGASDGMPCTITIRNMRGASA